jgi:hypothetical protein
MTARDIHERPLSEWGELRSELIGQVVDVEIVCAHGYGMGVKLVGEDCYGHVNPPEATDGSVASAELSQEVGKLRRAIVLAAEPGRQPTLSLRTPDAVP